MELSSDLLSQIVKVTKINNKSTAGETVIGTTVKNNEKTYVQLDGSSELTPVSTTADMKDGERVMVLIKDHTAYVTGNLSDPSASSKKVTEVDRTVVEQGEKITALDIVVAKKIDADKVIADLAQIEELIARKATIEDLNATNAEIDNLKVNKADVEELNATNAKIENLGATYANIDFANIGEAAIRKIFSNTGIIDDLVLGEGYITGRLVGVTIIGDLIEAETLKADRLVVLGEDGLYYKLNVTAEKVSAEQTEYNSLHGSIITAQSITAEKVNVDDLVAFDATIGGFNITENAIYSGVKSSADNTTRGLYMDRDGQLVLGDSNSYLKYYKDADGTYKLVIALGNGKTVEETIEDSISDIQIGARNLIRNSKNLVFDEYTFVDMSESSVLGIARLGLLTLGNENETYTESEDTGVATTSVEAGEIDDYTHQGFVNGMRLHDRHMINMENAIIKALGGMPSSRITTVSLTVGGWTGSGTLYSQTVDMPGVTANSKIDLLPSPEQLGQLLLEEISFSAANSDGTITVFAIGGIPSMDFELQAMITEVIIPEVNA